jgi:hypothetical protein
VIVREDSKDHLKGELKGLDLQSGQNGCEGLGKLFEEDNEREGEKKVMEVGVGRSDGKEDGELCRGSKGTSSRTVVGVSWTSVFGEMGALDMVEVEGGRFFVRWDVDTKGCCGRTEEVMEGCIGIFQSEKVRRVLERFDIVGKKAEAEVSWRVGVCGIDKVLCGEVQRGRGCWSEGELEWVGVSWE